MLELKWLRFLVPTMAGLLVAGCGGGGSFGDSLFPLWVETDVRVVDIDGDGRADVLTLAMLGTGMGQDEGVLTVRRQTSPGAYTAPRAYSVGIYPWKFAVGDIDGDGAPDVVVVDAGGASSSTGTIWMLRQDPANRGNFLAPQRLMETRRVPEALAIGDLNGDGVPDVMVATPPLAGGKGATILPQSPAQRGTFAAPVLIALPDDAYTGAIGDLNGDGRQDIVLRYAVSVTNYVYTTALVALYQRPDGTFTAPAELPSTQTGINSRLLAIADLNGDGAGDIVEFFTRASGDYGHRITALVQDRATGAFTRRDTSLAGIEGIDGAAIADLNGDGSPDVAIVGAYPVGTPAFGEGPDIESTLNILLHDGAGGFNLSLSRHSPVPASRLGVGDLDGDGRNDIVGFGSWNHVAQTYRMLQSPTAPGTFLAPVFFD